MGPKLLNETSFWKFFLLGREGLYLHCEAISVEMLAALLPPIGGEREFLSQEG